MRKFAARVDGNQSAIVSALRQCGCTVQDLSRVGDGCPDLLIGLAGRNYLLEVKDGSLPPSEQRLTADQAVWHADWRGQKVIVTSVSEALAVIGATSR